MSEFERGAMRKSLTSSGLLPWYFTLLALIVAEILFLAMKIQGVRLSVPVIPLSFGFIKDLADVVIIFIFPWHGWVFSIPLSVFFIFELGWKKLIVIFFVSTITTTLISSFLNFIDASPKKIITGFFTYLAINLFVLLFLFSLNSAFKKICKFRG